MTSRMAVAAGSSKDVCPNCGITRDNAGYLRETCGDNFLRFGCFVIENVKDAIATDSSEDAT